MDDDETHPVRFLSPADMHRIRFDPVTTAGMDRFLVSTLMAFRNRHNLHNYHIVNILEAVIELFGYETINDSDEDSDEDYVPDHDR